MDNLEAELRKAIARKVVEDFKDPLGPLRALTEAAYAAPGMMYTYMYVLLSYSHVFPCMYTQSFSEA